MVFADPQWYVMVAETIEALYLEELYRHPDSSGYGSMFHMAREEGKTAEDMRAVIRASEEWKQVHAPKPEIPTFSDAQLRAFKGNFCGIIIPGLPYHEGNGADKDVLFTPAYPVYPPEWRKRIREEYKRRGYTHFPVSLFSGPIYHDFYPDWDGKNINECLRELLHDGLIPVGFAHRDDGFLAQGVDTHLVPIVVPMWEMNGPLNNDTSRINQTILDTKAAFPGALLYVHFTSGHAAGGSPEADWWRWAKSIGVRGLLYQDGQWDNPQGMWDRCVDFLIRFGSGYHGWPTDVDFVMYENCAFPAFNGSWNEQQCIDLNDYLRQRAPAIYTEAGHTYTGDFAGFNNG